MNVNLRKEERTRPPPCSLSLRAPTEGWSREMVRVRGPRWKPCDPGYRGRCARPLSRQEGPASRTESSWKKPWAERPRPKSIVWLSAALSSSAASLLSPGGQLLHQLRLNLLTKFRREHRRSDGRKARPFCFLTAIAGIIFPACKCQVGTGFGPYFSQFCALGTTLATVGEPAIHWGTMSRVD